MWPKENSSGLPWDGHKNWAQNGLFACNLSECSHLKTLIHQFRGQHACISLYFCFVKTLLRNIYSNCTIHLNRTYRLRWKWNFWLFLNVAIFTFIHVQNNVISFLLVNEKWSLRWKVDLARSDISIRLWISVLCSLLFSPEIRQIFNLISFTFIMLDICGSSRNQVYSSHFKDKMKSTISKNDFFVERLAWLHPIDFISRISSVHKICCNL